jgi:hypothetical protein
MPLGKRLKRRVYRLVRPGPPRLRRQRLLERLPTGAVCAEIGVWEGDFAERILEIARPARLHLIDPWLAMADEAHDRARYGGQLAQGQTEMDARYEAVLERFERERRAGVVEVHRLTSLEAAPLFRDGELDFVYVDGDHLYEAVKADLEAYAPRVRAGGFLAGDDYGVAGWWHDGVTRAVDEFAASGRVRLVEIVDGQFLLQAS